MALNNQCVQHLIFRRETIEFHNFYPYNLAAVNDLHRLDFYSKITYFLKIKGDSLL